ncbi:OmpA family protein [Hypericibacter adhaerens]|nr:OmpA family protein [Hypericibacter adhaerens]
MIKVKRAAGWRRWAWRWAEPGAGLRAGSAAALLAVSILASACSSSDEPPPSTTTSSSTAPAASSTAPAATGNESFPNLGTVPSEPPPATPPEQRRAIVDGLISDRQNAVYSDQPLSGQPNVSVPPPAPPQPITPQGGGTTLGPATITPPSGADTGTGTGAPASSSAPPMPATPPAPVSSQPLPEPSQPAPAPGPTTQPQSITPQSNAAPLAPGDRQYADLSGETGLADDADPLAIAAPAAIQIAEAALPPTVPATAPRGLVPKGPFSYPQAKPVATAKPEGTTKPSSNRSVTVDLSVIGGDDGTARRQLPAQLPLAAQPAVARPPLFVDLGVLDGSPAPSTPLQPAVYQAPLYQVPAGEGVLSQPPSYQPGLDQLAVYQVPTASQPVIVDAGAVTLPPSGQPLGLIFFANGSAQLNAKAREVLHDLARIYGAKGGDIRIVGHASWVPGANGSVNSRLSYARAQAVAKLLMSYGVKGGDIEMRGVGVTQPVYYETARTGSAGNRRADIFLTP